jgi:hypothetical protein
MGAGAAVSGVAGACGVRNMSRDVLMCDLFVMY